MSNIFFTSDQHWHHANILTFTGSNGALIRPEFSCVEQMDEEMVRRWNAVVKPTDKVYHLGDLTMGRTGEQAEAFVKWMHRLNGTKRLILGNHDHFKMRVYTECGFTEIRGCYAIEGWALSHIPLHPAHLGKVTGNVHGHIHERRVMQTYTEFLGCRDNGSPSVNSVAQRPDPRYINVSVEVTNYTPVALEDLRAA